MACNGVEGRWGRRCTGPNLQHTREVSIPAPTAAATPGAAKHTDCEQNCNKDACHDALDVEIVEMIHRIFPMRPDGSTETKTVHALRLPALEPIYWNVH